MANEITALDPRKAGLVKPRHFIGLSLDEASASFGIAVPATKRWLAYARAACWVS
jgi:DNA-directed RNA polymerase specialized sigma24 family protein